MNSPGAKSKTVRIKRLLGTRLSIWDEQGHFLPGITIAGCVNNVCIKAIVCRLFPNP